MIYIVIARFVDRQDKAFPSVPTIAKKGSMSERQVQAIINSLVKKKLLKKDSRLNKDNKSKTSNLYTLLSIKSNQPGKDGDTEVMNDMHHPGEYDAPPLVNDVHPNNTSVKKKDLNSVNVPAEEGVVENSTKPIVEENAEVDEDVNEIRRKIKESLEGNEKSIDKPVNLKIDKAFLSRDFNIPQSNNIACLDYEKLKFPLILRKWNEGDYFILWD